jgi:hypothetical protein
MIKLRKMRCEGHVSHTWGEMRNAYKMFYEKPEWKRLL